MVMSTFAEPFGGIKKSWQWIAAGGAILLIWVAIASAPLRRARIGPKSQITQTEPAAESYSAAPARSKPAFFAPESDRMLAGEAPAAPKAAAVGRKIIRTSSIQMLVVHPAEIADKITSLAEGLGGYLVSADGGGQNATAGVLTIRVPSARFEEARTEIRKLGLQIESEKIDAQDVSRQYIDEDASLRNLRAEESQYLAILKQANTVKDMLAVTERLSEVRGQIEQQQAEFNALSRQIEAVALTISLRTEPQPSAFGLNWRPVYQLKLALHDGLESLANYATAMATVLFYLPAVLLWVGTILIGMMTSWKILRWAGRRWFGWTDAAQA
jgi:Domain of unknown function (DUF4349)